MRSALVLRHMVERAHVVQPVGELDQQDANILGDRQQQLAQVLRLLGLLRDEIELLQLGQALDELADVGAEELVDLLARGGGVLDRVVQQRDGDRRLVECMSVRIAATSSGCEKYGSPEARFWWPCFCMA